MSDISIFNKNTISVRELKKQMLPCCHSGSTRRDAIVLFNLYAEEQARHDEVCAE